ncbi:MAG: TMEM175 family protein [Lactobacillus crispatus]|nr:TMEM175 family protein [Lactobacillus crispatus]
MAIYEKFKNEPDLLYFHLMELNTGVIAIIVLEIQPPANLAHYADFSHDIGVFFITFLIVGKFWYDLHNSYAYHIYRPGKSIAIVDLLLLGTLSLMPVMAKWVMLTPSSISIANYGAVFLVANLLLAILQILGFRDTFEIDSKTTIRITILRTGVAIVFNLILIALSFVSPYLSMILYLGFPIVNFIVSMGSK